MTQTRFPRPVGDCGNAQTWPFPVIFRIVPELTAARAVRELDIEAWLQPLIEAARHLQRDGAEFITTTCGLLSLLQRELSAAVEVPVLTSSLMQVPWLATTLGSDRTVGILTFERASLSSAHLQSVGITDTMQVEIVGMEEAGEHFRDCILNDRRQLDVKRAREEHVKAAKLLCARCPPLGAIVLECANMPPYADAIAQAARVPVYDITTLVRWAASGAAR